MANRSPHQHVWSSRRYRSGRAAIFERDGYSCRIPVCKLPTRALWMDAPKPWHPSAPTVDHIVKLADGGDPYDPANQRAAHWRCNSSRGASEGNRARGRQRRGFSSAPAVTG